MARCPNCEAEVATDAARCDSCGAVFNGTDWKPLVRPAAIPSRRTRIFKGVAKVLIVLMSLAWLLLGGTVALHEKSEGWVLANAAAAVLVIGVALATRTTWSGVLMFGCVALGVASCGANFHLNMR